MSPLSPTLTSTCISLKVESVVSLSSDGLVLCIVEGEPPRLRVAGGTGSICEKDGCAADTCRVGDKTGRERSSGRAGRRAFEARRVRDAIELRRGQVRSGRIEAMSAQKQQLAQLVAAVLGSGQSRGVAVYRCIEFPIARAKRERSKNNGSRLGLNSVLREDNGEARCSIAVDGIAYRGG